MLISILLYHQQPLDQQNFVKQAGIWIALASYLHADVLFPNSEPTKEENPATAESQTVRTSCVPPLH